MFKQPLQTGGLLLVVILAPTANAQFRLGFPVITSVTPMTAGAAQTIIIKGQGFGTHAPYIGQDIPYIAIHDDTHASAAHWEAGHVTPSNWDAITLSVARWTDTEIQVTGFGEGYGRGTWRLSIGDQVKLEVWNPQTGAGPATYELTVETPDSKTRNLITNPDFEEQLAHWSVSQGTAVYTADPTVRHAGRFSVKGVESSITGLGRLFQDVTGTLVPGWHYVLSGWIRTQSVAGGTGVVIALYYVDTAGWTPPDGSVMEIGNVTGTQDWTFFQSPLFILPPMPPDAVALCVVLDFDAATGTAWFDDLRLSPVESLPPQARPGVAQAGGTGNTPKVSLGQTVDEVIAILGKPDQIVDLGTRVIYVYKARRIVFTDGKVTDLGVTQPPSRGPSAKQATTCPEFTLQNNLVGGARDTAIAWSPDGQTLASVNGASIWLWNHETGRVVRPIAGNLNLVYSLLFNPDGSVLASAGRSGRGIIQLWDPHSGRLVRTLDPGDDPWSLAFDPKGRWMASGGARGPIELWDARTGDLLRTLSGHGNWVLSLAFGPDAGLLASGGRDRAIKLWDPNTGLLVRTLPDAFRFHVGPKGETDWPPYAAPLAFSPDGRWLVSGSNDLTIKVWDSRTGELIRALTTTECTWCRHRPDRIWTDVWSVAFSPDGRCFVSGSGDGAIRLWDPTAGALIHTLDGHVQTPDNHIELSMFLSFSPNGRWLAAGNSDGSIKLWKRVDRAAER